MSTTPIILVPGYWLGAWAWDEVASALRRDGLDATALTLPGLDAVTTDRSSITFTDHVDAIGKAVEASDTPVVLVVHSGAGATGYAASDRIPDRIAAIVYVDTGPTTSPMLEAAGDELPMPAQEELAQNENLEGLSEEQLQTFRERAVPEPGLVVSGSAELTNGARLAIPSIVICTSMPSEALKGAVAAGEPWAGDLPRLRNLSYVDLPTSHWPMWSRPSDLAAIISDVATSHG